MDGFRSSGLLRMRVAVIAFFLTAGVSMGSWVARIPAVKERDGLTDAQLGVALLGSAVGAIAAMSASGWLIGRVGSKTVTSLTGIGVCLTLPIVPHASGMALLFLALLLFGACYGTMDVAMNAQAVLVEARYARPIMSSFHGVYSLGGLLGAATAGVIAGQDIPPERHLLAIGALLLGLVLIARSHLIPASGEGQSDGPAFALATGPLAGIGAIAFCVLVAEGAMADWSAVFLREVVGAGPAVAAMGYTAFSLTMAAVRFAGDSLTERLGPVRVIRSGGVLVAVGLTLALLTAAPVLTLIGFGLVGVGLAAAFPITLSAAGRTPRVPTGTAIAAVATAGYAGFLVGPPVIGFVSHASSLRFGLACVLLLGIAIALLAGQVARAAGPGAVAHVAAADAGADV